MENLQGGTIALEHRYRILERDGRRNEALLYEARQEPFRKRVWLEIFDGTVEDGEPVAGLRELLKSYAHRAGQIDAPGVLRILDYGELESDSPFVISERISGMSLRAHLEKHSPLDERRVANLIERLADVLAPIHEDGYVHGYLHPNWVFVGEGDLSDAQIGHFQVGLSVGLLDVDTLEASELELNAVSPELYRSIQQEDPELDPAANYTVSGDIYGLGLIAHRALTGEYPQLQVHDSEESSERASIRVVPSNHLPPYLSDPISKALSTEPADRHHSAMAFADDLRTRISPESGRDVSPKSESPQPDAGDHQPLEKYHQVEGRAPGPSDVLVTVLVILLVFTNLAWYFWATG